MPGGFADPAFALILTNDSTTTERWMNHPILPRIRASDPWASVQSVVKWFAGSNNALRATRSTPLVAHHPGW